MLACLRHAAAEGKGKTNLSRPCDHRPVVWLFPPGSLEGHLVTGRGGRGATGCGGACGRLACLVSRLLAERKLTDHQDMPPALLSVLLPCLFLDLALHADLGFVLQVRLGKVVLVVESFAAQPVCDVLISSDSQREGHHL